MTLILVLSLLPLSGGPTADEVAWSATHRIDMNVRYLERAQLDAPPDLDAVYRFYLDLYQSSPRTLAPSETATPQESDRFDGFGSSGSSGSGSGMRISPSSRWLLSSPTSGIGIGLGRRTGSRGSMVGVSWAEDSPVGG